MKSVDITGTTRTGLGKKASRVTRKEGFVPCVIYGGENVVHCSVNPKELKPIVYTSEFKQANVTIDGTTYKCILKESQFHPVSDALLHVDFLQLVDGHAIKVDIPVHCDGPAAGVKEGGVLTQKLRKIKVKTTPDNLVEELIVDIKELKLGQSVRVKDIQFSEGMEVMSSLNIPVASVGTPRALKSLEAEEEEAAAAAEAAAAEGEEGAEGEAATEGKPEA